MNPDESDQLWEAVSRASMGLGSTDDSVAARAAEVDRLLTASPMVLPAGDLSWQTIKPGDISTVKIGEGAFLDEEPEFPPYSDPDALRRFSAEELAARLDASLYAGEVSRAVTRFREVEESLAADGYVFVDGTWRKPPGWDPLATAVPLWDELPELPENLPPTSENLRVGLVSRAVDTGSQTLREVSLGFAGPFSATQHALARSWEWSGETAPRRALRTALPVQWAFGMSMFVLFDTTPSWLLWQAGVSLVVVTFVAGLDWFYGRRDSRSPGHWRECWRCGCPMAPEESECLECAEPRPETRRTCPCCAVPIGPTATWCAKCEHMSF